MEDYRQRKQDNLVLLARERQAGKSRLLAYPSTIQVEPTNRCNLRCLPCARRYWQVEHNLPGQIVPKTIEALFPLLPTADWLVIGGYGEPLISPMTGNLIEAGRRFSCRIQLITNASLLDDSWTELLANAPIDLLVFSVDAASDQTNLSIRGITVEEIWKKIADRRFYNLTRKINVVLLGENMNELPQIIDRAADCGVFQIEVINPKIYGRAVLKSSPFLHRDALLPLFESSRERAAARKVVLCLPDLDSTRSDDCIQPFEMLFLRHNGDVHGCCSALFGADPHPYTFLLGNLDRHSLPELWNCLEIIRYREGFFKRADFPRQCRRCAFRHPDFASHRRLLEREDKTA